MLSRRLQRGCRHPSPGDPCHNVYLVKRQRTPGLQKKKYLTGLVLGMEDYKHTSRQNVFFLGSKSSGLYTMPSFSFPVYAFHLNNSAVPQL